MNIRSLGRIAAAIIISMTACVSLLLVFAFIPRASLKNNAKRSADYFTGHEAFPVLFGDCINSIQDNYADTYTLAVAYGIDEKQPFTSAMKAMYTQESMRLLQAASEHRYMMTGHWTENMEDTGTG